MWQESELLSTHFGEVNNATARWYVAQIKSNAFERAIINLSRQGFQTFIPLQRKTIRHARQMTDVLRPIFPGYLFVCLGEDRGGWRKVNSTQGVIKLIAFGGQQPTPVPNGLVAALQSRCDQNNILQPATELELGTLVKVVTGPFSDFTGTIESLVAGDRIRLLLQLMGQDVKIDLHRGSVEPT